MEMSGSYFQITRNKYDSQTNTYLSLQSSDGESGPDEFLQHNVLDSRLKSNNSVTRSDCNAWLSRVSNGPSLLNTPRTRDLWNHDGTEHTIGAWNASSAPDRLGISEGSDRLSSSAPRERFKSNVKRGTDLVFGGSFIRHNATPRSDSPPNGFDQNTDSKSSERGSSPRNTSRRHTRDRRGPILFNDDNTKSQFSEDRLQPIKSPAIRKVTQEALPASSSKVLSPTYVKKSLDQISAKSGSSGSISSRPSAASEDEQVSICVAPREQADHRLKEELPDVLEEDRGFRELGSRRRTSGYNQNEERCNINATQEDVRLATKSVSRQFSNDVKVDELPVVVDSATVENCRFYEALMELYVGFIGIQAVFTYANFVFSNFAGGVLSLFGIIAASYSHLDRRVSSYILTATIYSVIVIVISIAVSTGIDGLASYKEDTMLKAISIGSIPLGIIFIFGNIYLAHQHWMLSRRLKVLVESSRSPSADVDERKGWREERPTSEPRQTSHPRTYSSRRVPIRGSR